MLAGAARLVYCASPFGGEACARTTVTSLSERIAKCKAPDVPKQEEGVKVALINDEALAKIKPMAIMPLLDAKKQKAFEKQQKQEIEKKVAKVKKEIINPRARGQIVEITKPQMQQRPKKARYLSEFDSAVKKQTVARGSTEKMVARPGPKDLPTTQRRVEPPKETRQPDKSVPNKKPVAKLDRNPTKGPQNPGKLAMRRPGPKKAIRADKAPGVKNGSRERLAANGLAARRGEYGFRTKRPERPAGEMGGGGKPGGRPKVPDLRPSRELLRRAVGGGSVDKLDNVRSGDRNALNTKRWKYASFFNRLKRQVAQNWHPDVVYLRRDPHGNVYGNKDRITVLRVTLSKDGSVRKVFIQRRSGVGFLDDEAVRAMRAASPFPNPPSALANNEKLITFSFGFHFQIGGRSDRWRIFRYR
jgi:TonB family protein